LHLQLQQSPDVASTTKTLYVGGLKEDVITEDSIKDYFKQFGNIEKIYWSVNKETGTKRPYCFVYFDDSDAVDKIVCKCLNLGLFGNECIFYIVGFLFSLNKTRDQRRYLEHKEIAS